MVQVRRTASAKALNWRCGRCRLKGNGGGNVRISGAGPGRVRGFPVIFQGTKSLLIFQRLEEKPGTTGKSS